MVAHMLSQSGQFMAYAKSKGETDPEKLAKTQQFDDWFDQMLEVAKTVGQKMHLKDTKIHVEALYLPFAEQQPDGRLKFVGIHYDQLPKGITLALVPLFAERSSTGEQLPNSDEIINQVKSIKQVGKTMFIDNRLTVHGELDATAILPPEENIEILRSMVHSGKRDQKAQAKEALQKVKNDLGQFIINHPNILGKDVLGKDYEGIVLNTKNGHVKITSPEQKQVIANKQAAQVAARTEQPRPQNKTAVVAVGSAIGHVGHQQLFNYAVQKAKEVGGDPYMFIGPAEGKDDPIPPSVKVQTWHKLYPQYANNISTMAHEGGTLLQKIKHELINPLPGKAPRYDNIIITVGTDRAELANSWSKALMKAVNKFQGYEHVRVTPNVTGRGEEEGGTGVSGTQLRNVLKDVNKTPEQQFAVWNHAYNSGNYGAQKLAPEWIHHLMDIARKGMGLGKPHTSPSGVRTNMPKNDDDYAINYGPEGLAKPQEPVNIKEANKLIRAMRAKEFIAETTGKHHEHHRSAHQGVGTNVDPGGVSVGYHSLRSSMAAAMADGTNNKIEIDHESWAGPKWTDQPYTEVEHNMLKQVRKAIPTKHEDVIPWKKSEEPEDTNKTSTLSARKKNKYGI
jgi:hypothetical protein